MPGVSLSLWNLPAWQVTLLGLVVCVLAALQDRIYRLPAPDDPANRGCLRVFHDALALSRWLIILIGSCTLALGILRWTSGM